MDFGVNWGSNECGKDMVDGDAGNSQLGGTRPSIRGVQHGFIL